MPSVGSLVLFYGPPFAGKTRFFFERFSLTHTRMSRGDLSVHRLVKAVAKKLQEGVNVGTPNKKLSAPKRKAFFSPENGNSC